MKKLILLTLATGVWLAAHTVLASGPADTNGKQIQPNLDGFNKGTNMRYVVNGANVVVIPKTGAEAAAPVAVVAVDTNTAATNTVTATNTPPPTQTAATAGDGTPQPGEQPPPATTASTNTSTTITLPNGEKGLLMNFRGVPLETVLNFMSDAAGFVIHPKVDVSGKVTIWNTQPLTKDEAVKLLSKVLNENGYTAIQDERTLTIIRSDEAGKNPGIPVHTGKDPKLIPRNDVIVTQIIPVRSLNVVALVKNLQTLLPSNATMTADESANSIMLTDTQANIHRIVEIIDALDSVTSGNSTIQVFPLKYADSKTIASLIKDLFPAADNSGQNGGSSRGNPFSRMRGMMAAMGGGGPGGDTGGGGDTSGGTGHTPTAKVNAVSDDHSNSLIVSAPDELMPTIAQLVKEVDTAVEDTTVAKTFHLKNADPGEMADLLTALFPDESASQADASRQSFRGFGFGGFPGMGGNQAAKASESDRMKKMARVIAVADRRTASLIVTAGTNAMIQIETIITELDASSARKLTPHIISLSNADPIDVQMALQSLFPSTSGSPTSLSSSTSNPNDYLGNRSRTLLQQQNSQTTSSFGSSTGGSSRTGVP